MFQENSRVYARNRESLWFIYQVGISNGKMECNIKPAECLKGDVIEKNIKEEPKEEPNEDLAAGQGINVDRGSKESLTHKQAMSKFADGLMDILCNDPLLHDLPPAVTLEEVNSQIALEYGQAMTVNVEREDGVVLPVVVISSASVLDLKKAIKRHMTLKLERMGHTPIVSWRYIWKRYCLMFEGQKLLEDQKPLKEYGIRNRDKVTFMKVLKQK